MAVLISDHGVEAADKWIDKATDTPEFKILKRLNEGRGAELIAAYFLDRLPQCRNLLASHFSLSIQLAARRVYRTLSQTQRRSMALEEIEQISQLVFHTVIDRFEPDRKVPLSAFLHVVLPRAIIDELRRLRVCSQGVRKVNFVTLSTGDDDTFGAKAPPSTTCSSVGQCEFREFRKTILHSLNQNLRLYAAHRYLRGQSVSYASKKAGIGRYKAFEMQRDIATQVAKTLKSSDE